MIRGGRRIVMKGVWEGARSGASKKVLHASGWRSRYWQKKTEEGTGRSKRSWEIRSVVYDISFPRPLKCIMLETCGTTSYFHIRTSVRGIRQ